MMVIEDKWNMMRFLEVEPAGSSAHKLFCICLLAALHNDYKSTPRTYISYIHFRLWYWGKYPKGVVYKFWQKLLQKERSIMMLICWKRMVIEWKNRKWKEKREKNVKEEKRRRDLDMVNKLEKERDSIRKIERNQRKMWTHPAGSMGGKPCCCIQVLGSRDSALRAKPPVDPPTCIEPSIVISS